jgi:hypothetical protein
MSQTLECQLPLTLNQERAGNGVASAGVALSSASSNYHWTYSHGVSAMHGASEPGKRTGIPIAYLIVITGPQRPVVGGRQSNQSQSPESRRLMNPRYGAQTPLWWSSRVVR